MDGQKCFSEDEIKDENKRLKNALVWLFLYLAMAVVALFLASDIGTAIILLICHLPLLIIMFKKKKGVAFAVASLACAIPYLYSSLHIFISLGKQFGGVEATAKAAIIVVLLFDVLMIFSMYFSLALFALKGKKRFINRLFVFSIILGTMVCVGSVCMPLMLGGLDAILEKIGFFMSAAPGMIVISYIMLAVMVFYAVSWSKVRIWICPPAKKEKKRKAKKTENYIEEETKEDGKNNEYYVSLFKHVLLLFVTFGIYQYIWIYRATKFTNLAKHQKERVPMKKLLLCVFVPFYIIYWTYKTAQRVDGIAKERNVSSDIGVISLVLAIFVSIIPPILIQAKINQIISEGSDKEENVQNDMQTLQMYKKLLDDGILTQEEFEAKKKQILGL